MKGNEHLRSDIGTYRPPTIGELPEVDLHVIKMWREIPGLSSTVSDILDELGYLLSLPATFIPARLSGRRVIGRAITVRYLPERRSREMAGSKLIHQTAMKYAENGDILVIEGDASGTYSVFGGLAAHRASQHGIGGVVVDGAVRDLDQIVAEDLPVWSKGVTAKTGRGHLVGVGINVPIRFHGVQVLPGDVVVADDSGICFVPLDVLSTVHDRLMKLVSEEREILQSEQSKSE